MVVRPAVRVVITFAPTTVAHARDAMLAIGCLAHERAAWWICVCSYRSWLVNPAALLSPNVHTTMHVWGWCQTLHDS